jgi:hypothetical protein
MELPIYKKLFHLAGEKENFIGAESNASHWARLGYMEGGLSQTKSLLRFRDIFKHSDEKIFFKFLSKLRETGLVNMFESGQFLVSGPKYLQKFIEFDELKRDMIYDKDMVEELLDLSQQTKDEFIRREENEILLQVRKS